MLAKYFSIIRHYVLSVSSQRRYNFYHQNTLLDAFQTNSRNIIGRNPSMVIPLLANQDLTPKLFVPSLTTKILFKTYFIMPPKKSVTRRIVYHRRISNGRASLRICKQY